MSFPFGPHEAPTFNNSIWNSERSLRANNAQDPRTGSPHSPAQQEITRPAVLSSADSQDRMALNVEKVGVEYHEASPQYNKDVSVQFERTQDRRSLAGKVYGPPMGAPPGHYKRPGPIGPVELKISRMGGSNFKKGSFNSVIEVLLEEPRISIRARQRKSSSISISNLGAPRRRNEQPIIRQNPKRIRIRSPKLLKAMENISTSIGHSFLTSGTTSLVFLYPFKLFVTLESAIREALTRSEVDLRDRESGSLLSEGMTRIRNLADETGPIDRRANDLVQEAMSMCRSSDSTTDGSHRGTTQSDSNLSFDDETLQHLRLLVEVFDTDLKAMFDMRRDIKEKRLSTIAFVDLWHLFEYGQDVRTDTSDSQVYRVMRWTGGREPLAKHGMLAELQARAAMDEPYMQRGENRSEHFIVECVSFEFDGNNYGPVQKTFVIRKYDGEKAITHLTLFPLAFDPNQEKLRERLIARGTLYLQLSEGVLSTHKHYSGLTLDEPHEEVDSQIIVDTRMAMLRYYITLPPVGVSNLVSHNLRETYEETINPTVTDGICSEDGCCDNDLVHKDYNWELQLEDEYLEDNNSVLSPTKNPDDLDDEEKLLLPPYIYGFILRSRKWAMFDIDLIKDVQYTSGFDDLVLPQGHKETVRALVANHAREPAGKRRQTSGHQSMDLVRGKGKGLIILLHGAPGVGKTSTAECVADSTKRPLFPITCGDVGDTASEVEANLESSFQLAHKWGCVLLLDEADIFMQKRDKTDIKRNSIVSVFLRAMEYYSGILFLTTNRVGLFDPAFRSRIHISLYYPGLQKEATMQIWKMHIARTLEMKGSHFKIKSKDILKFAKEHYMELKKAGSGSWNGRQIRNAFQTAIALAEYEAADKHKSHGKTHIELSREHFATVAQASKEFDKYLRSTLGGQTEADMARLEQTRVDDFHSLMDRLDQTERLQKEKGKGRRKAKAETDSEESESADSEASSNDDEQGHSSGSGSGSDNDKGFRVEGRTEGFLSKTRKNGRGRQ